MTCIQIYKRQIDKQTETSKQIDRQRLSYRNIEKQTQTIKHIHRQPDREVDSLTDRQKDKETNRQQKVDISLISKRLFNLHGMKTRNRLHNINFQALVENVANKLSGGHHQLAGAHQAQQAAPKVKSVVSLLLLCDQPLFFIKIIMKECLFFS